MASSLRTGAKPFMEVIMNSLMSILRRWRFLIYKTISSCVPTELVRGEKREATEKQMEISK